MLPVLLLLLLLPILAACQGHSVSLAVFEGGATFDTISEQFFDAADYCRVSADGSSMVITPSWYQFDQIYTKCLSYNTCCRRASDCAAVKGSVVENDGRITGLCNTSTPKCGHCQVSGWCPTIDELLLGHHQRPITLFHGAERPNVTMGGVNTIRLTADILLMNSSSTTVERRIETWSLFDMLQDNRLPRHEDIVIIAQVHRNNTIATRFITKPAVNSLNEDANAELLSMGRYQRRIRYYLPGRIIIRVIVE